MADIHSVRYAEDTTVTTYPEEILENFFRKIDIRSRTIGLEIYTEKANIMTVTKNSMLFLKKIAPYNKQLDQVQKLKRLAHTLTSNRRFNHLIKIMIAMAKSVFNCDRETLTHHRNPSIDTFTPIKTYVWSTFLSAQRYGPKVFLSRED